MMARETRRRRGGFTLVELLVVMTIVLIVSVAALPVVLPAIRSQGVSTSALMINAELSRARDEATRANAPRGFRLMPDRDGRFAIGGPTPAYSRLIAIEPAPDYSEGRIRGVILPNPPLLPAPLTDTPTVDAMLGGAYTSAIAPQLLPPLPAPVLLWPTVWESKYELVLVDGAGNPTVGIPRPSTSWFWNVRKGDKIRVGNSGRELTIVGPDPIGILPNTANFGGLSNPEQFVNWGPITPTNPGSTPTAVLPPLPASVPREFLVVLDGIDNDGDGYIDEAFDGIDNDGDGIIDPMFNGIDDPSPITGMTNGLIDDPAEFRPGEWEPDAPTTLQAALNVAPTTLREALDNHAKGSTYTILRQPVPSQGAREISLSSGVVIDMTTNVNGLPELSERSRLPVRPTGAVDVMLTPSGQVVQPLAGRVEAIPANYPFFHFWITDGDDVVEPITLADAITAGVTRLPLPLGVPGYTPPNPEAVLKGNRRLVSINTRSGQVTTSSLDVFDITGIGANRPLVIGRPYRAAESGVKEQP
jgi:prepilin-type N-terminal cleavage/methylation domain-containing protein